MLWAQVPVVQYGVMMTGSMVHGKKSGRTAAAVLSWGGRGVIAPTCWPASNFDNDLTRLINLY